MNRYSVAVLAVVAGLIALLAGCTATSQVTVAPVGDLPVSDEPRDNDRDVAESNQAASSDPTTTGDEASAPEAAATDEDDSEGSAPEGAPSGADVQADVRTGGAVFFAGLDVPIVGVTSPSRSEGARPVLSWLPVEGAATYELNLHVASGEIYWAWSGAETSIPVGGEPLLGPNSAGPSVIAGMFWYVLAIDDSGSIVGQTPIITVTL